jgi:uncharacterized membrane protein
MNTSRLEAFSDGVFAIIITIMVLEMKVPEGHTFSALLPLLPIFLSYLLSFVYLGIYWNNHHHLFHASSKVSGSVLWANLHLLFWLSLVPFTTGWMGENEFGTVAVALYGFNLLMAGFAYYVLTRALLAGHGADSVLAIAIGNDRKGMLSLLFYALSIPLAFVFNWGSMALFLVVAVMWLIPDKRIENQFLGK